MPSTEMHWFGALTDEAGRTPPSSIYIGSQKREQQPMIQEVIAGLLYRSSRPGYPSHSVAEPEVRLWVQRVKALGITRILCLLKEQLSYYDSIPGGLLEYYRASGLEVLPFPVRDLQDPPVPDELLERAYRALLQDAKPTLIHCSAGVDRTGALVRYVLERHSSGAPEKSITKKGPTDAKPNPHPGEPTPDFRRRVETYMRANPGDRDVCHYLQVTANSMRIYDALQPVHGLEPRCRAVLWAAAMLHDIGTANGAPRHGWRSAEIILEERIGDGAISPLEIAIVASLHRREGADGTDGIGLISPEVLRACPMGIPTGLLKLSAILRVADGLVRYPPSEITGTRLEGEVLFISGTGDGFEQCMGKAKAKSTLLRTQLGISIAKESNIGGAIPPNGPAVAIADPPHGESGHVIFDLQGTLVHHQTGEVLPMIPGLIHRLRDNGQTLSIVTKCEAAVVESILQANKCLQDIPIFLNKPRPQLVRDALLRAGNPVVAWYVDDKPDNLRAIADDKIPSLGGRIIAFVGSGKYFSGPRYLTEDEAACGSHKIPMAHSPKDLLHQIAP